MEATTLFRPSQGLLSLNLVGFQNLQGLTTLQFCSTPPGIEGKKPETGNWKPRKRNYEGRPETGNGKKSVREFQELTRIISIKNPENKNNSSHLE